MHDFQQRVVAERSELDGRIERLDAFLKTPFCESLPAEDQNLLLMQADAMRLYSDVLRQRIARFA